MAALLLCHGLLAVTSILEKSNTFDELIHLTAGYGYWTRGDYRFQPENGNLPQRWASLPLLFEDLSFPQSPEPTQSAVWSVAQVFFFQQGNDARKMLFSGRVMMVATSLILGLLIFSWAEKIFGTAGALVSLTLFAFSPTLLAHGRLTTSDTASALFFLAATRSLWDLMHRVDGAAILWAGAATAGLILSKMSGVLILPMALGMGLVRLAAGPGRPIRRGAGRVIIDRPRQAMVTLAALLAAATICTAIVWGAYGFRFSAAAPSGTGGPAFARWEEQLAGTGHAEPLIRFCRDHRLLPEAYLYGLSFVLKHAERRTAFMAGRYSERGWKWFFPFCFAVKTPLGVFVLLLLALGAVIAGRKIRIPLYEIWPLIILCAVYSVAAVFSHINIGHRHLLPLYPPLFVLAGAAGHWLQSRHPAVRLMPVLALGLFVGESLAIWPHYLAFFNAASGGPARGYRRLVDSSLDWGQDLPALKGWIDRDRGRRRKEKVYLAYFGTASPAYHRVTAWIVPTRDLPWMVQIRRFATTLAPGTYCISATVLQQVYEFPGGWTSGYEKAYETARRLADGVSRARDDRLALERLRALWGGRRMVDHVLGQLIRLRFARLCAVLRKREPDAQVGYSILIYRVSADELDRALHGPPPDPAPVR